MTELSEITVSISDRSFNVDISVKDIELIDSVFKALMHYVNTGCSIKVRETYMNDPTDSLRIITKIISKPQQMKQWRQETKSLISVLRKCT